MPTKTQFEKEEVKLDSKKADGYSPEMETSIWYN
jgi:hypothetical protein